MKIIELILGFEIASFRFATFAMTKTHIVRLNMDREKVAASLAVQYKDVLT